MASNADLVQYIMDQCSGAGDIAVKKMMGDYCIYCDGILFGLICDNNLFVKVTEPGRAVVHEVVLRPPYPGARDYFYIEDVDDMDYLAKLVRVSLPALANPRAKKASPLKRNRQVPITLDDVIVADLTCSQDLRAFFEQYLGSNFAFTVEFQKWLHEHDGYTYRDAVDAYKSMTR